MALTCVRMPIIIITSEAVHLNADLGAANACTFCLIEEISDTHGAFSCIDWCGALKACEIVAVLVFGAGGAILPYCCGYEQNEDD